MFNITLDMVTRMQTYSNGSWDATWAQAAKDPEWAPILKAMLAAKLDPVQMVRDFRNYMGTAKYAGQIPGIIANWNAAINRIAPQPAPATTPMVAPGIGTQLVSAVTNVVRSVQGAPTGTGLTAAVNSAVSSLGNLAGIQTSGQVTQFPSVFNTPAPAAAPAAGGSGMLLVVAALVGLAIAFGD